MKKYTLGFAHAGLCDLLNAHGVGDFTEINTMDEQTDECHYYSTSDQPVWLPDDAIPLGIVESDGFEKTVYFLIPVEGG